MYSAHRGRLETVCISIYRAGNWSDEDGDEIPEVIAMEIGCERRVSYFWRKCVLWCATLSHLVIYSSRDICIYVCEQRQ